MGGFQPLHGQIGTLAAAQIFFIGGAMKSGTTWLQLLLNAHPHIACRGEGHVANHLAPLLAQCIDRHNLKIAQKNRDVFHEIDGFPFYWREDLAYMIGAALLLPFAADAADKMLRAVGEKTPDNVRHFDLLRTIFPEARFLHVVRDGRDCAVSAWFHNLRATPEWTRATYASLSNYAAVFAQEWATDIAQAHTFAAACPGACLTVRYESLVDDTAAVLRGVLDFLGLDAGAGVVAQCCDAARFERLSDGRARGTEDSGSFFRSGTSGNWRDHLDEAANRAFIAAASPWLEVLGYV
ncbi:MAG TPA: sulfotransferase [Acetobacteraceae bacterium]|nr:sulfotransferase [Acetobacteraceae bacterium]